MFKSRIINGVLRRLDITGYFCPWGEGQPAYYRLPDNPDLFLPLFSTVEKLKAATHLEYESVKCIDDQVAFMASLPVVLSDGKLRFMIDPWITVEGNTRFTEIIRDEKGNNHGG
jgi:hypothetical protein